jgi:hypothetical protein
MTSRRYIRVRLAGQALEEIFLLQLTPKMARSLLVLTWWHEVAALYVKRKSTSIDLQIDVRNDMQNPEYRTSSFRHQSSALQPLISINQSSNSKQEGQESAK